MFFGIALEGFWKFGGRCLGCFWRHVGGMFGGIPGSLEEVFRRKKPVKNL